MFQLTSREIKETRKINVNIKVTFLDVVLACFIFTNPMIDVIILANAKT